MYQMNKMLGNKPKTIRKNNFNLILNLFKKGQALSISDISSAINLSRTTIAKINDEMLDIALITSLGKGNSTDEGGKKPELYILNKDFGLIISFHILEHVISIKYFDITLELIKKKKIFLNRDNSLEKIIKLIDEEIESIKKPEKLLIKGIAVAIHGIVDSEKGLCYTAPHFPSWGENRNIKKMIVSQIGSFIPVYVESWIRFKTYGTKVSGDVAYQNYVLMDAGLHGIVSGVFMNGKLLSGSHYLSGEVGHTIVSACATKQCYCGGYGCLETFIDCKNLVEKAFSLKEKYPNSLIFSMNSMPDIFTIFNASNKNDLLACELMEEVAGWFAIGLSNMFLIIDPEVIFFEGDYSLAGEFFQEKLSEKIKNISLNRLKKDFKVIFDKNSHNSTALGAASYVRDFYFNSLPEKKL